VGGGEGALTGYSLLFGTRCVGTAFDSEVAAVFLPHLSWVKPVVLSDPAMRASTLRHEQTHFDLTEVYARRLRKYLAEAYDPCGPRSDEVRTGAERYISGEALEQRRYDEGTRHGLLTADQAAWQRNVEGWLADLDAYRAPHP
jgi:hypothetical protein